MKKGDILLTSRKLDPVGWIIRLFTHCPFHHCALAINKTHLVEVVAKGKQIVPLKKYLNKWVYKIKLVRIKDIFPCKLSEAVRRAEKAQLKFPYSSTLINFLLIKLKITKKLPRLSCSSFISYYLAQVGFYFNRTKVWFVTPKDIEKSKKVKNITKELY